MAYYGATTPPSGRLSKVNFWLSLSKVSLITGFIVVAVLTFLAYEKMLPKEIQRHHINGAQGTNATSHRALNTIVRTIRKDVHKAEVHAENLINEQAKAEKKVMWTLRYAFLGVFATLFVLGNLYLWWIRPMTLQGVWGKMAKRGTAMCIADLGRLSSASLLEMAEGWEVCDEKGKTVCVLEWREPSADTPVCCFCMLGAGGALLAEYRISADSNSRVVAVHDEGGARLGSYEYKVNKGAGVVTNHEGKVVCAAQKVGSTNGLNFANRSTQTKYGTRGTSVRTSCCSSEEVVSFTFAEGTDATTKACMLASAMDWVTPWETKYAQAAA